MFTDKIKVYINHKHHANLDSFPIRYGYYYKQNTILDLYNCTNWYEKYKGQEDEQFKVNANFLDLEGNERKGHFVLMDTKMQHPIVVTIWSNDTQTEHLLSDHLKELRKQGDVNQDYLVRIHPYYLNGEANSVSGLIATIKKITEKNMKDEIEVVKSEFSEQVGNRIGELEGQVSSQSTEVGNRIGELEDKFASQSTLLKEIQEKIEKDSIKINAKRDNPILNNKAEIEVIKDNSDTEYTVSDNIYVSRLKVFPKITGLEGIHADKITKFFGPPGTGKTTTLISIVKKYIEEGISPNEIGFFSYTNTATNIAKNKIKEVFPHLDTKENFNGFKTLHSIANQALSKKYDLINKQQALDFDTSFRFEYPMIDEDDESSRQERPKHDVIDAASIGRQRLITFEEHLKNLGNQDNYKLNKWLGYKPNDCSRPIYEKDFERLVNFNDKYEKYKKEINVIDFTSMLELAVEESQSIPSFKVLIVDEAQDLTKLQFAFLDKLIERADFVYIAGDDDQAICEGMGASPITFINYQAKNESILSKSYRIPTNIHNKLFSPSGIIETLQKKFVRKNKEWFPKETLNLDNSGITAKINWNSLLNILEKFPQKNWLIMGATKNTLNQVSNMLSRKSISHYLSNELKYFNILKFKPTIRLKTIWGAKGDEADCTVLIVEGGGFVDQKMFHSDPRLIYVAETRTKLIHLDVYQNCYSNTDEIEKQLQKLPELKVPMPINDGVTHEYKESKVDNGVINSLNEKFREDLMSINSYLNVDDKYKRNSSILKDVILTKRPSRQGHKDCVELIMEDGTKRGKNYGDLNKIYQVASKLKGLRIYNDVTGTSSETQWFNNFSINEDEDEIIPF